MNEESFMRDACFPRLTIILYQQRNIENVYFKMFSLGRINDTQKVSFP